MDRHFLIPVTIAAALHGLLLGLPRGPIPHIAPTTETLTDASRLPDAIMMVRNDPPPGDEVQNKVSAGDPVDVRRLPESPTIDPAGRFIVPITPGPTRLNPGLVYAVPAKPFGDAGIDAGGEGGLGPINAAMLDKSPRTRVQIAPDYPPSARRESREGEVTVEFVVDETGRVRDPHVAFSSDSMFDDSAVKAVARWRFEPGTVRGTVVRFKMAVPILFRLSDN